MAQNTYPINLTLMYRILLKYCILKYGITIQTNLDVPKSRRRTLYIMCLAFPHRDQAHL